MKSGKYLSITVVFFIFLSILLIAVTPIKMGNAIISSYFSTPGDSTHYSQVPDGTNISAYITIDNTKWKSYDLINYSLKVAVFADLRIAVFDEEIDNRIWSQNFTLDEDNKITIQITFNATRDLFPGDTLKEFYIWVEWGEGETRDNTNRLAGVHLDSSYVEKSFFSLTSIMILITASCMGIVLFIIVMTAKKDVQKYRARHRPAIKPTPPPVPLPPPTPSPAIPAYQPVTSPPPSISTRPPPVAEPKPGDTMELIPCPNCSSKIDKTQLICPNCGYELPKCVVCNLFIDENEEIETCPECGATGHRAHFLEWVRVKGICPICKNPISF